MLCRRQGSYLIEMKLSCSHFVCYILTAFCDYNCPEIVISLSFTLSIGSGLPEHNTTQIPLLNGQWKTMTTMLESQKIKTESRMGLQVELQSRITTKGISIRTSAFERTAVKPRGWLPIFTRVTLRKHAYLNTCILKISQPKTESFQIKILKFFIFLLKTERRF